jgi:geranylgeranyl reductase family protein
MKLYDITIIGGGPAGSILAYLCSKAHYKTLIIEKEKIPRFKACGGGLTYKSIKLLKHLNLYKKEFIEKVCNSVEIHLPRLQTKYLISSPEIYMATVNRAVFDKNLINEAVEKGCETLLDNKFLGFEISFNNIIKVNTVKGSYKTKILIGADGVLSRVYKQLSVDYEQIFPEKSYLFAVTADIPFAYSRSLDPNHTHLFFDFADKIDYAWAFPKKESFNVGFGLEFDMHNKVPIRNNFLTFMKDVLRVYNYKPILKGGLLPVFCSTPLPTVQWENILLLGDAAGFVDEWTGEGLYYSIKSAENAFKAIRCYYDKVETHSKLHIYTKECSKNIFNNLMFSHYFARIFRSHPGGYRYLTCKRLREMFLPFARGQLSYSKAFFRSLPTVLYLKIGKEIRSVLDWSFNHM